MTKVPSTTSHFVLVHGASHGGWCWYKIRCLLEVIGHTVTCPDLRASGIDLSDPDTILTFQEYNQPLDNVLSALPEGEKVILVGHSAGGLSVTDAMYKYPGKIQVAVIVGGMMLKHGFQPDQDFKDLYHVQGAPDHLSKHREVTDYGYGLGRDQPPTSVILKKESSTDILYQRSPLEDVALAGMLWRAAPNRAILDAKFGDGEETTEMVPRVYIKTSDDNVLSQDQQDAMIKRWPPSDVHTIDSDHFPLFSNPLQLFALLLNVADKFGCHSI